MSKTKTDERVKLAKIALKYGRTRGQFLRDNSSLDADSKDLQSWWDAYTYAMQEIERDQEIENEETKHQDPSTLSG